MRKTTLASVSLFLLMHNTNIKTASGSTSAPRAPSVVCRDDNNHAVDWFIIYKEPGSRSGPSSYIILTDTSSANGSNDSAWSRSENGFGVNTDGTLALHNTLQPLENLRVTYAMYSDQPPVGSDAHKTLGHSKGVIAQNGRTGFFLTHSLPRFPYMRLTPAMNQSKKWSHENGQIFLCISFDARKWWPHFIQHVTNLKPKVYQNRNWQGVQDRGNHIQTIQSLQGKNFTLISKSEDQVRNGRDLYEHIIAPQYREHFSVTAWRRGSGDKIVSNCAVGAVRVIEDVSYVNCTVGNYFRQWSINNDHSKWAVSREGIRAKNVFCIGDMNRMRSQTERPGGAVCMEDYGVVQEFRKMVGENDCTRTPPAG